MLKKICMLVFCMFLFGCAGASESQSSVNLNKTKSQEKIETIKPQTLEEKEAFVDRYYALLPKKDSQLIMNFVRENSKIQAALSGNKQTVDEMIVITYRYYDFWVEYREKQKDYGEDLLSDLSAHVIGLKHISELVDLYKAYPESKNHNDYAKDLLKVFQDFISEEDLIEIEYSVDQYCDAMIYRYNVKCKTKDRIDLNSYLYIHYGLYKYNIIVLTGYSLTELNQRSDLYEQLDLIINYKLNTYKIKAGQKDPVLAFQM